LLARFKIIDFIGFIYQLCSLVYAWEKTVSMDTAFGYELWFHRCTLTTLLISFTYPLFFLFIILFILFCCKVHHLHCFTGTVSKFFFFFESNFIYSLSTFTTYITDVIITFTLTIYKLLILLILTLLVQFFFSLSV